ncbi:ribokinase [Burkholderiaceae bacterium UC74_6]
MTKQDKTNAPRVAVVGSINMDMVSHSRRLPAPGETLMGETFVAAPGGKGANQAVAASRLGASVSFVSRVGTREHGETLLAALASEGVAFGGLRDPQALPGIAVIMVASEGGENAIVVIPGSNADLRADDVDVAAYELQSANVVVAQLEVPQPPIRRAFEIARAAGRITVLNAAPALPLEEGLLPLTDWLVLNETEAEQLSGLSDVQAAAKALLARGPKTVLVTLGGEGALLCNAAGIQRYAATKVHAVDTVGAGDTFVGGLATGLAEGRGAPEAIRLGQAAAAIAVSRSGVQSAMPKRAELGAEFS